MKSDNNFHETIWSCFECDNWWLTQAVSQPDSWRMFRMPSVDALMFEVGKCPTWLITGSDLSVCPECGATLTSRQLDPQRATGPDVARRAADVTRLTLIDGGAKPVRATHGNRVPSMGDDRSVTCPSPDSPSPEVPHGRVARHSSTVYFYFCTYDTIF